MKTKTTSIVRFIASDEVPCRWFNGIQNHDWNIWGGLEYEATDFNISESEITFSLWDEHGWIGDYIVKKEDFVKHCRIL